MLVAASSMKVSIHRLMVDPEFYVFNYAESIKTSEFLIINEELLEIAPFVDSRLEPYARGRFTIPTHELDDLVANMPQARPRQYYIFHHAFVCSTLLARCLAQSKAFFSLKEPQIVRRLADMTRIKRPRGETRDTPGWGRFLNTHLQLLAKNYRHGDSVVVKASNLANILMPEILRHTRDGDFQNHYPALADASGFNFLQQCAVLWLASNDNFLSQAAPDYPRRVRTLNMEEFLASPRETLSRASRFFDHEASEAELDQMAGDEVMKRHAKDPNLAYDTLARERENAGIIHQHGPAIAEACRWLESQADAVDISDRLAACSL